MTERDPQAWTLTSLAAALRAKEVSPVEAAKACLGRIEALDPTLNTFITVTARDALAAARAAEAEILKGKYRGPLHGVPVAVKDLFLTKGIRTTCGSKILSQFVPTSDAALVERLHAAGAVLLGKLNMHEFAFGTTSVNPHYGAVRNPWDVSRITGGSSGGSAAAVSASFVMLALGTDTGGSIRIPSALCGVCGLKPTYGRLSRRGVYPLAWSLDHPGPIAKTVSDIALAMSALADRDPRERAAPSSASDDLTGVRLGVPDAYYTSGTDPEIARRVAGAIAALRALGAQVRSISIPSLDDASSAAAIVLFAESAASLEKWHQTRSEDLGADVRARLDAAASVTATQYLKALRVRTRVRAIFARAFEEVDAIVTPQLPITAPPIGDSFVTIEGRRESIPDLLTRFTRINNLVGMPALTVRCGFSSAGLPIAVQIAGRPFEEARVLAIGAALERIAAVAPAGAAAANRFVGSTV